MELQEAIEHAREVTTRENVCESCREEHGQLADWLEELKSIREILGDCDLDRLKDLVELAKNIPHVCRFCVGCEMEPKDGHGCDEYDSFVFSTRRLQELADANLDGRCVVLPSGGYCEKDGENALKSAMHTCYYHNNPVTRYIADAVAEKLTREEAEAALKGEQDG